MSDEFEISVKSIVKVCVFSFLGLFAFCMFWGGWTIIQSGEKGLRVRFGSIQPTILNEGMHLKVPFIDSIKKVDIQNQKLEVQTSAYSKDLQPVKVTIAINFFPIPSKVDELIRGIGFNFQDRVIQPTIQESLKAVTAKFTAAQLIEERQLVKEEMLIMTRERLQKNYIEVADFSITNFDFSDSYEHAIEEKQVAQQNALKAKNDLERIQIEAQQKVASARAEAESIRIKAEALKQNQELVKLEAVKKWDGVLPKFIAGGNVPFIMDMKDSQ